MPDQLIAENGVIEDSRIVRHEAALSSRHAGMLRPCNFDEAMKLATIIAGSDLAPKDFRGKPDNVLVAIQMGSELGLAPMQAVQNIAVINGRPSVWGDALLAIVQGSGLLDWIEESDTGHLATCRAQRRGYPQPIVGTFGDEDARRAGLSGKAGPWTQYPSRMRKLRARAFALRDGFADVLRGLNSAEELSDYPETAFESQEPRQVGSSATPAASAVVETPAAPQPANPGRTVAVSLRGKEILTAGISAATIVRAYGDKAATKRWLDEHGGLHLYDLTESSALAMLAEIESVAAREPGVDNDRA